MSIVEKMFEMYKALSEEDQILADEILRILIEIKDHESK